MIGQSIQYEHTENRDNMLHRIISDNSSNPAEINYPQVDVRTLEEKIASKVRSDVDNVITSVGTSVQDAVLTAIEKLVIPRVELAVKSADALSERSVDGNVLEPDQRDF